MMRKLEISAGTFFWAGVFTLFCLAMVMNVGHSVERYQSILNGSTTGETEICTNGYVNQTWVSNSSYTLKAIKLQTGKFSTPNVNDGYKGKILYTGNGSLLADWTAYAEIPAATSTPYFINFTGNPLIVAGGAYTLNLTSNQTSVVFCFYISTVGYAAGAATRQEGGVSPGDIFLDLYGDPPPSPPTINNVTLTNPAASSVFVNYTTFLNFTGVSETRASFPCWRNVNGTFSGLGNATNNTQFTQLFNQTPDYYVANVTCTLASGANTTSQSNGYHVRSYSIGTMQGPVSAYELQNSTFNVTVFVAQNVTGITGLIEYNGTNYTAETTSNATAWVLYANATAPLVSSNASNVNYRFWFSLTYNNATVLSEKNLTAVQRIDWAAAIQEHASTNLAPNTGEEFSLTSKVAVYYWGNFTRAVNFTLNNTVYPGTLYFTNATHEIFIANLTGPSLLNPNATVLTNSTLFVTSGLTFARNSTGLNVTFFSPFLGVCTAFYTNLSLNVSFFNEEDFAPMNGTLEWAGTIEYPGGSMTLNGTATDYSIPFCLYPPDETFNTTMTFNYFNTSGYSTRQYYFDNAILTSTPTNLSLYLQTAGQTANITIRVIENGLDVASLVQFQRYYVALDSFRIVSMVKTSTDPSGSVAKLRPFDVDYLVVVLVDGVARGSFYPVRVTSNAMTFDITSGQIGKFWTTYGDISGSCAFTNSTGTISCTVTDGSGLATSSSLVVKKVMPLSEETVCTVTSATAGATHVCNLGNSTDSSYSYYLTAVVGGETITLASGTLTGTKSNTFGTVGLFLAGLIVLAIAMSGSINPASMIIMAFLGVLLASFAGLAILTTSAIVGLGIVGGLLIYRVRT